MAKVPSLNAVQPRVEGFTGAAEFNEASSQLRVRNHADIDPTKLTVPIGCLKTLLDICRLQMIMAAKPPSDHCTRKRRDIFSDKSSFFAEAISHPCIDQVTALW